MSHVSKKTLSFGFSRRPQIRQYFLSPAHGGSTQNLIDWSSDVGIQHWYTINSSGEPSAHVSYNRKCAIVATFSDR